MSSDSSLPALQITPPARILLGDKHTNPHNPPHLPAAALLYNPRQHLPPSAALAKEVAPHKGGLVAAKGAVRGELYAGIGGLGKLKELELVDGEGRDEDFLKLVYP